MWAWTFLYEKYELDNFFKVQRSKFRVSHHGAEFGIRLFVSDEYPIIYLTNISIQKTLHRYGRKINYKYIAYKLNMPINYSYKLCVNVKVKTKIVKLSTVKTLYRFP